MQPSYTVSLTVPYPECDVNNRMRISNIMRHVQQMGGAHLDSLGLTYHRMAADGVVLLLAKEGMTINRLPEGGERIHIETTPRKPKGATLLRDCTFYAEDGSELLFVETTWVAADTKTHRIVRPDELAYDIIPSLEEKDYAVTGLRVRQTEHAPIVGERVVRFSDIDCNRHLNNAVYGDIVYDFLPVETVEKNQPKTFFMHFQHEAGLGECLTIRVGQTPEGGYVVTGTKASGEGCFTAMVRF